jgi:streptogramin lyase
MARLTLLVRVGAIAVLFAVPLTANATSLRPGELVWFTVPVLTSGVTTFVKVDPVTGAQQSIFSTDQLQQPFDLAIDAEGIIFVVDRSAGSVVRIDTESSSMTTLASGLDEPAAIRFDAEGRLLITDPDVIRIDPQSGTQTLLSVMSTTFRDIDVDPSGNILLADFAHSIVQLDPITGLLSTVSAGTSTDPFEPLGIAVDDNGSIFATDFAGNFNRVVRVDPGTGDRTLIAEGDGSDAGNFSLISLDLDGNLVVASGSGSGDIFFLEMDPTTGQQEEISSGGLLFGSGNFAIVPIPEPSTALLLAFGFLGLGISGRSRKETNTGRPR